MPQIINKPIEKMTLTELKQERSCHSWQATKSTRGAESLEKRLYWLEQNEPIQSREEIQADYDAGRLSEAQYKTAFARRARAINYRRRAEHRAEYSRRLADEERALLFQIDERILHLEATAPKPKRGRPPKRDPRHRQAPKRETYKLRHDLKPLRKRWASIEQSNRITAYKSAPIPYWNTDTISKIALDRGFFTEEAFTSHIAQELQLTYETTKKLLRTGTFSFAQALLIGAYLEMTPKEFCDTFLYNYFRSPVDGLLVATIDNKQLLQNKPVYRPQKPGGNTDYSVYRGHDAEAFKSREK